ncbi:MAG: hypothetical protein LC620_05140, partial [Halobacteriales archaeon]|nr:hypothetical protein [Halobacteriales archaeon]
VYGEGTVANDGTPPSVNLTVGGSPDAPDCVCNAIPNSPLSCHVCVDPEQPIIGDGRNAVADCVCPLVPDLPIVCDPTCLGQSQQDLLADTTGGVADCVCPVVPDLPVICQPVCQGVVRGPFVAPELGDDKSVAEDFSGSLDCPCPLPDAAWQQWADVDDGPPPSGDAGATVRVHTCLPPICGIGPDYGLYADAETDPPSVNAGTTGINPSPKCVCSTVVQNVALCDLCKRNPDLPIVCRDPCLGPPVTGDCQCDLNPGTCPPDCDDLGQPPVVCQPVCEWDPQTPIICDDEPCPPGFVGHPPVCVRGPCLSCIQCTSPLDTYCACVKGIVLDPGSACEVPECPPGETGVPPVCLVAQARPPGCDAPTGGAVCRVAWQPPVPPADVPRPAGVVWVGVPG